MAFKINADGFAYSAAPEKVSESYAAELAKKLVADEEQARQSEDAALVNKIEQTAAEERGLRSEADRSLDARITLEASRLDEVVKRKADKAEIPTKASELENDRGYLTEHQDISGKADKSHTHRTTDIAVYDLEDVTADGTLQDIINYYNQSFNDLYPRVGSLENSLSDSNQRLTFVEETVSVKEDKVSIGTMPDDTIWSFRFDYFHNVELRFGEMTSISFVFGDGEYADDYMSGLSFDSGATPTAIDYTGSKILNWVGTDCTVSNGLSIFQPSSNTHYDIVFYYNGNQFIGLVNGYVPASGNEAV